MGIFVISTLCLFRYWLTDSGMYWLWFIMCGSQWEKSCILYCSFGSFLLTL